MGEVFSNFMFFPDSEGMFFYGLKIISQNDPVDDKKFLHISDLLICHE